MDHATRPPKRSLEAIALAVAIALHLALALVLWVRPDPPALPEREERVTVNLASEIGMTSTAPDPVAESAAPRGPTLADRPSPSSESAAAEPFAPAQSVPVPASVRPAPAASRPRATRAQQPRSSPRPTAVPRRSSADTSSRRQPDQSRSAARETRPSTPARSESRGGASRIDDDFLAGSGSSATSRETRTPASAIGPSARASLLSQITRELRPNFDPPSGVEVDKLVSVVRFRLNADGSLNGSPALLRQTGVSDANRAQSGRHGEQALRAVRLAAPFDLPSEYHEAFKSVTINFDASL